ncbi:TSUP family transporter [Dongshaea marina]|uniref:TSUP family transporter n=1 Tax=Dongshaea marina TaxID=2047966 RepID=UPI001900CFC6|nr:TSUP family transporter [Dongshaea marina]
MLLLLCGVAMLAGCIDAIAGGGGLLTVPALLAAGLPPAHALATNKLQSSFGSFSSSFYFVRKGIVKLSEMKLPIACTFIGAAIGAILVQHIHASILEKVIPGLLIAIALYFLFSPGASQVKGKPRISDFWFAIILCSAIGFYDGFFGPGTGSFFTIAFVSLARLDIVQATARTKVLNFTSNIAALLLFILGGMPIWSIGLSMAVGQFIGARLGARLVVTRGRKLIRPLIVMVAIAMAFKLLIAQHPEWFGLIA